MLLAPPVQVFAPLPPVHVLADAGVQVLVVPDPEHVFDPAPVHAFVAPPGPPPPHVLIWMPPPVQESELLPEHVLEAPPTSQAFEPVALVHVFEPVPLQVFEPPSMQLLFDPVAHESALVPSHVLLAPLPWQPLSLFFEHWFDSVPEQVFFE